MDIGNWLRGLGLERYAGAFRDGDIGVDVLPDLSDADLKELGVSLGDRRRLLKAARSLHGHDPGRVPPSGFAPKSADEPVATAVTAPERRQLTVMFVDLVGSTALGARLDPEEMRDVLLAYQNAVAGEVARFEGQVAKLMGDGVLCYFGWPRAHEDEAERAVRAGLAAVAATGRLRTPSGEPLAARAGIATGLAVVGDLVGSGPAREEAVVGTVANLAARLQALAAPGRVVVAGTTRRLLGRLFELDDLGRHRVKGIETDSLLPTWRVATSRPPLARWFKSSEVLHRRLEERVEFNTGGRNR